MAHIIMDIGVSNGRLVVKNGKNENLRKLLVKMQRKPIPFSYIGRFSLHISI